MDTPKPTKQPTEAELQIWREALAQLRHLADDFNRTFYLLVAAHVIMLISICAIMRFHPVDAGSVFLIILLVSVGAAVGYVGHYMLQRQRIYYLQMLAKKSLFEEEFGLYGSKFANCTTDFALPWRLTPQVVAEIRTDFDAWVNKSIRSKGTIARWQFVLLELLLGIYGVILVMLVVVKL